MVHHDTNSKKPERLFLMPTIAIPHPEYHIAGLFPYGANFPERSALSFGRNFPNLEIHDPNNQKTHVSDISHKVYTCTCASGCR